MTVPTIPQITSPTEGAVVSGEVVVAWSEALLAPLDGYETDLSVAYSVRHLLGVYADDALRVRESSGSTEADIGFDGGFLDESALLTHTGANSGFVPKWYDQSGNDVDLAQTTANLQPRIVDAGTVDVLDSGVPAPRGDGADLMTVTHSGTALTAVTIGLVVRPRDASTGEGIFSWANTPTSTSPFVLVQRNGTDIRVYVDGNWRFTVAVATDALVRLMLTWDGSEWVLWVDGVAETPYADAIPANKNLANILYLMSGFADESLVQVAELLIWSRALSDTEIGEIDARWAAEFA